MSEIFKNRINQFLYNGFKIQSNNGNVLSKTIKEAEQLYEDLISKFGNVSNMSNAEIEKVKVKLNEFKAKYRKISNIVNSLNNTLNTINSIIKIISTIITVSRIIIRILTSLPIPAQFMTSGMIVKFSDIVQKADKKITFLDDIIKSSQPFINKIIQLLLKIKEQLNALDKIIALIEAFLSNKNSQFLQDSNLLPITPQSSLVPNTNIIGYYNGFTFELRKENDPKYQVGDIKRNYAIAIDSKGLTRLKSQASFASDSQILVDELKFEIDKLGLKS